MEFVALDPEARGVAAGTVAVLVAALAGWLAGRVIGKPLEDWSRRHATHLLGGVSGHLCGLIRSGVAAVLLAAASGMRLNEAGELILASGLALAVALFARGVARSFGIGRGWTAAIALLLFTAVIAGRLGGLAPFTEGLDRAYLTIGKSRISLFDVVSGVIVALLLFAAARGLNRLVGRWVASAQSLDLAQRVLFQKIGQITVTALAFFIGVDLLGIDLTALAVFSGAFGLAVGFGFQKTFGNLISGLILLLDRSIKPGDVIAVEDTFGWVNKIGVRYVSLVTRDGKEHLIPNETLMTQPVENWSYSSRDVRIHIPVGVAHGSDIHRARVLMLQAANETPRVLADPAPVCWVTAFTHDAIAHEIRLWINDPENGVTNVQSEVLTRIWELFRAEGIVLPFHQQDVYLHQKAPPPIA